MKQHIKNQVRELYINGQSTRKIAKIFSLGNATVYRRCIDIIRNKSESLQKEKHPLYMGGSVMNGYLVIWDHGKLKKKHRLIMGEPKDMVVHHKDGNKLNNDPSNLEIMSKVEHTRLHNTKRSKRCANT